MENANQHINNVPVNRDEAVKHLSMTNQERAAELLSERMLGTATYLPYPGTDLEQASNDYYDTSSNFNAWDHCLIAFEGEGLDDDGNTWEDVEDWVRERVEEIADDYLADDYDA